MEVMAREGKTYFPVVTLLKPYLRISSTPTFPGQAGGGRKDYGVKEGIAGVVRKEERRTQIIASRKTISQVNPSLKLFFQ